MSFLQLEGKTVLVAGLANRRSVAWATAQVLEEAGATVVFTVRNEERRDELAKLTGERPVLVCDVEKPEDIARLGQEAAAFAPLHGFVHSIAFANYAGAPVALEEAPRADFLQAVQVSAYSFAEMAGALKPHLHEEASCVAISISSTEVTAAQYGYMAAAKAALDAVARGLAKSFSAHSRVRFNCVKAGPLKTKSSAGIPGYLDNFLYAEKLTYRKAAVTTQEVASAAAFLLSPRSSGINAQGLVVNAGMDHNYFDEEIVAAALRSGSTGQ